MAPAYSPTSTMGKSGPIQNGYGLSETDKVLTLHEEITAFFGRLRPTKTWGLIQEALGLKEHAARHRAACHRAYTPEEIRALLQSDRGDEILEIMMADAEPAWWKGLRLNLEASRALAAQAQWQQTFLSLDNTPIDQPTRRKLKKVADADRVHTASVAATTVSAGLLHQDRSRALAGAMAPAKAQAASTGRTAGGRGR
jgi:hypothetical protein